MSVAEPSLRPIVVGCPHCRQAFRVNPTYGGRKLNCPKCRGEFIIPKVDGTTGSAPEHKTAPSDASQWAIIAAVAAVHIFIGLMMWALGVSYGVGFIFCLIIAVELAVWQRRPLTAAFSAAMLKAAKQQRERQRLELAAKQAQEAETAYRASVVAQRDVESIAAASLSSAATASTSTPSQTLPKVIAATTQSLPQPSFSPPFVTQTPLYAPQPPRSEPIPPRPQAQSWFSARKGDRSLTDAGANLPPHVVTFFGPGSVLQLDRARVHSPLVYATATAQHGSFDASLIDGSLAVTDSNRQQFEELPYWPTYYDASPHQRSKYLDWLVEGRSDPRIELGYVFIYFYGLERRVIVDDADHQAVAEEVLRLQPIYSYSRSFQRYSASLLWMIVALAAKRRLLSDSVVERTFATTERWDVESLGRCLAYLVDSGARLDARRALLVAQQDHRVPKSVVVRRHVALFGELFAKKYAEQFPGGMELRASKKERPLSYHPASSTLSRTLGDEVQNRFGSLPNVLAIESQFKPLVGIWNECIEDLKVYDKAHRTAGHLSVEAFEALPPELRNGDHPDFDRWFEVWKECSNADAVPIVPLPRLAALKNIAERRTLLKPQCQALLNTATCLGFGIEPDFRSIGRNYRWDDTVVLFLLDGEEPVDVAAYQAASSLLQLGLYVAESDGKVHDYEIARIARHLEDQFKLSPNQSRRLEALRFLLLHTKPDPAKVFAALKKRLSTAQRLLIGEYLLGIAAADQIITAEENACLRHVFNALDLSQATLQQLLQPIVGGSPVSETAKQAPAGQSSGFYLDPHAISRIMRDTEAVATILRDAMVDTDSDEADEAPPAGTTDRVSPPAGVATLTVTPQSVAVSIAADSTAPVSTATTPPPTSMATTPARSTPVATPAATTSPVAKAPAPSSLLPPPRFHAFLKALVAKDEWPEADAKQLARQHQVMLSGAIEALNEWSQERWNDWLIEEGDPVRVRRDLLKRKTN